MFKRKKRRSREFKNSEKVIDFEQARADRRERRKGVTGKKDERTRKIPASETSGRKMNKKNRKRLIYCCIVLTIVTVIGVSVFHVHTLQKEYQDIVAQNKSLEAKRQKLNEELGNVNNPEYIEQQARRQLKMVRPGEVLYILPTEDISGAAVEMEEGRELLPAGEEAQ